MQGRAEVDLAALCAAAPGMKAHTIRPGYFRPEKEHPLDWPNQRSSWEYYADRVFSPVFNCFIPGLVAPLNELSSVALGVAKGRWPDVELFRNRMIRDLAKEESKDKDKERSRSHGPDL